MTTINLNAAHIKAAALFAANNDIRYYLNGVLVESSGSEQRIVATDGHAAAVLRTLEEWPVLPDVIIPEATVKLALGMKLATLALSCDDDKWSLAGIPFTPVDGRFPDYRRVFPSVVSGEAANFNIKLLDKCWKAAKALGYKGAPVIRHNGQAGALVQLAGLNDEFIAVLMPHRDFSSTETDTGITTWASERSTNCA